MMLYLGRPKLFGQQRGGCGMWVVIDADSEMGLGFLSCLNFSWA